MTPEEAETKLLAACREAVKRGMVVTPSRTKPNACCPYGALYGARPSDRIDVRFPPVQNDEPSGFRSGFDGIDAEPWCHPELYALGLKFRQMALSGGFDEER